MTSFEPEKLDFETKPNIEWDQSTKVSDEEKLCQILEAIQCQVQDTGLFISEGEFCGQPVFYSPKLDQKVFFNCCTNTYEILDMGIQTTPYQPSESQICASAQYAAFELVAGATTVGDIVAAILAANPLEFDVAGNPVAVTDVDVEFIKITPKACGTLTSEGVEVLIDYVNVNGSAASDFVDLKDGGVDGATLIEVPVGGCSLVDVCFSKCWSKQEVSAL